MKSNEEHYNELVAEARKLVSTHEFGGSRKRSKRLREVVYLLDAVEAGQNIVYAKLAYDPDDNGLPDDMVARLRHHIGSDLSGWDCAIALGWYTFAANPATLSTAIAASTAALQSLAANLSAFHVIAERGPELVRR